MNVVMKMMKVKVKEGKREMTIILGGSNMKIYIYIYSSGDK